VDDLSEPADHYKYRPFEHRAFGQVDQIMAEPFPVADTHRQTRIARPDQAEPRPPPFRRHQPHRPDDTWIDPDAFEGGMQFLQLDLPV
jgi:hypothetical protein